MGTNTPGKYIIGLTGNIGTGKSLVLKMLEQKGAIVIDADAISRRVMLKDAPAYQPVLDEFGRYILGEDGEIDRKKLGRLVFADENALRTLENIVHPFVRQAIHALLDNSTTPGQIFAIEAVKLLEGPLKQLCDAIWVVTVRPEVSLQRLVTKRGMSEQDARQRIEFQGSDEPKRLAADVLINNEGSASETWRQVSDAFNQVLRVVQQSAESPLRRVRPGELPQLQQFITKAQANEPAFVPTDDRAFLFLKEAGEMQATAGWFAENYIARCTHILVDPSLDVPAQQNAVLTLAQAVEQEATLLQCEVLLFCLPLKYQPFQAALQEIGYQNKTLTQLGIRAWADAAKELDETSILLVKPLSAERVLKPL